jgi:hypothetical protein
MGFEPRGRSGRSPAHGLWPLAIGTPVLVIGGLVVCVTAGLFLLDRPSDDLPGVALGSETILVVERIVTLFTAWMIAVVVVARAWRSQLPAEISSRGIRYAEADSVQGAVSGTEAALSRLETDVVRLQGSVFALQTKVDRPAR